MYNCEMFFNFINTNQCININVRAWNSELEELKENVKKEVTEQIETFFSDVDTNIIQVST